MPVPAKWKLVAGSVTAVVGVSGVAAADAGSEKEEIRLEDTVQVTEVATSNPLDVGKIIVVDRSLDDSLSSPFDSTDTVDSPDTPDSVDSPVSEDSPVSIDSPDSPDSLDSPVSVESPDSVDSPVSVDSPQSPDSPESVDSP